MQESVIEKLLLNLKAREEGRKTQLSTRKVEN